MMKTKVTLALVLLTCMISLESCSTTKKVVVSTPAAPAAQTMNLQLVGDIPANRYVQLDYGIRLNVSDGRAYTDILKKYDASVISKPVFNVTPEVKQFVSESTRQYMRTIGLKLDADVSTDYMLSLSIKEFSVSYLSGVGWSGTVQLEVEVSDHNRQLVYPTVVAVGRHSSSGVASDASKANAVLNRAYANALNDIDWDRIAFFLKRASSPAQEKNKQVTGEGNTALEATVIRWFIDSKPKGADVTWRVVSSTSEVKNTNANYVGSTPYETTETFDIKGLTYNNSGDVQVEVSCEKEGYITQKKRFNVRQAIDQKEISTKFNLVKEDE